MLIDDIKKLQKYKEDLKHNEKKEGVLVKKIEKIEKKYHSIKLEGDGEVKEVYMDKYNSKVLVLGDGSVVQTQGPLVEPHFLSFAIAFGILMALGIPFMFLGFVIPELLPIADAVGAILNPIALVVSILTAIFCKETVFGNKQILLIIVLSIFMNTISILI